MATSNQHFRAGDRVQITLDEHSVEGQVLMASGNGCSLILSFEAILGGYVGSMAVLQDQDHFIELLGGGSVRLEPLGT